MTLPAVVRFMQLASGLAWLFPLVMFLPAVGRIWTAPRHGPTRPDPIDVLVSPLAFIALLQIGFVMRWIVFPNSLAVMAPSELAVWAGLYSLSMIAAAASIVAWMISRRVR